VTVMAATIVITPIAATKSRQIAAVATQSVHNQFSPQLEDDRGSNAERGLRLSVLAAKQSLLSPSSAEAQAALENSLFHLTPVLPITGFSADLAQATFNPTASNFVLSRTKDHLVQYWELPSATQIWQYSANEDVDRPIKFTSEFSPKVDKVLLATLTDFSYGGPLQNSDGQINYGALEVISVADGKPSLKIELKDQNLFAAFISANNNEIVGVSQGGNVFVWDINTGELIRQAKLAEELISQRSIVSAAELSPTKNEIAINLGGDIVFIDLISLQAQPLLKGAGKVDVNWGTYTPDGKNYIIDDIYGGTRIVDIESSSVLAKYSYRNCYSGRKPKFSPSQATTIMSCNNESIAKISITLSGEHYKSLEGHTGGVNSAEFGPKGDFAVTASADGTARVWDLQAILPTEKLRLEGHMGEVLNAQFSHDGKYVLSVGADRSIRVWPMDKLQAETLYKNDKGRYQQMAFNQNGQRLAATSGGPHIDVIEVETGVLTSRFKSHQGEISSFNFHQQDEEISSFASDGSIRLWNTETGEEKLKPLGHYKKFDNRIGALQLFNSSASLISGSNGGAKLWHLGNDELADTIADSELSITALDVYAKGNRLVVAGTRSGIASENTVQIWQISPRKLISEFSNGVYAVSFVTISPDGRYLITSDLAGNTFVYNPADGTPLTAIPADGRGPYQFLFSEDASIVAVSFPRSLKTEKPNIVVSDAVTNKQLSQISLSNTLVELSLSQSNRSLYTGSNIGELASWNIDSGARKQTFVGHNLAITSIHESPNGEVLLSTSGDKRARIWNLRSAEQVTVFNEHSHPLVFGRFLNSDHAVTVDERGIVCKWHTATAAKQYCQPSFAKKATTLPQQLVRVTAVDLDEANAMLAVANDLGDISVWNLNSGTIESQLKDADLLIAQNGVSAYAAAASGEAISVAGVAEIHGIWDTNSGKQKQKFQSAGNESLITAINSRDDIAAYYDIDGITVLHSGEQTQLNWQGGHIRSLAFAAQKNTLLAISELGEVMVWNAVSGDQLLSLPPAERRNALLNGDGSKLFTAEKDGVIRQWNVPGGQLTATYTGHRAEVYWIKLFEESGVLLSTGFDFTARLWDIETATPLAAILLDGSYVERAADYHPASGKLAFASSESVKILRSDALVRTGGNRASHIAKLLSSVCSSDNSIFPAPLRKLTKGDAATVSALENRVGEDVCQAR